MSSEQQERQAFQYLERSSFLTVRTLLKILDWAVKQGLHQDTAYKIGLQTLEDLVKTPYSIDTIDLENEWMDKPVDVERLKDFLQANEFPIAVAFQDHYLHFYTKDRSILDTHLEALLKQLASDPEKMKDFVMEKTLDEEIKEAKELISFEEVSSVKTKEMVL